MDLSFTEVQEMLRNTARDFLVREYPVEMALQTAAGEDRFSPDIWQKMAELGWLGMLVPERYGGSERSLTDLAVIYEEMGWATLTTPHLSSCVLSALTVLNAGTEDQKLRLLPAISRGDCIVAPALTEPEYGWDAGSINLTARQSGSGFVLDGTKLFIPDVAAADELLCAGRTSNGAAPEEGLTLFLVEKALKGVSWRNLVGFHGEKLYEVKFDSVEVPGPRVLGGPGMGWAALAPALEKATALLCEYMIGGCRRVYELSLEYSRTRVQFGVNIGAFQRVQDIIIEMLNNLDRARWATYYALSQIDQGEQATKAVSLAKAVTSEVYWRICQSAHDVHAGAGVMKEYPLHLYTKSASGLYHYLGSPAYHRKRLGQLLGL